MGFRAQRFWVCLWFRRQVGKRFRFEGLGLVGLRRFFGLGSRVLTGPKPKEIKVETVRIDYLIKGPKVEKLSLQPIRYTP